MFLVSCFIVHFHSKATTYGYTVCRHLQKNDIRPEMFLQGEIRTLWLMCRNKITESNTNVRLIISGLIVLLVSKSIIADTSSICAQVPNGHFVRSSQSCDSYNRCINGQVRHPVSDFSF